MYEEGTSIEHAGGLVGAVLRHVEERDGKVALCEKTDGSRWSEVTYGELYSRVRDFEAGLSSTGVERRSRVAIISTNRVEWPVADLAIISLGAVSVPVYPTLEADQIAHILEDSAAENRYCRERNDARESE